MTPRIRSVLSIGALLCAAFTPNIHSQEAAPAANGGSIQEELRALRQIIELQSRQIDGLTAQITRLGAEMERRGLPGSTPMPTADATTDQAPPAARVVTSAGGEANVHIVVKGDSLEKIAKKHNTTIAEIQKLNNITDPKKLQIGQQVQLPSAPEKKKEAPEATATEVKKEGQ